MQRLKLPLTLSIALLSACAAIQTFSHYYVVYPREWVAAFWAILRAFAWASLAKVCFLTAAACAEVPTASFISL